MLLQIPDVLNAGQAAECRQKIEKVQWVDGRVTAGHQSARAKNNLQLADDHPLAQAMGELILSALAKCAVYVGGAAAARFSAAFQSLRGRAFVRQSR
jgi:PKHD-type hydroxylase